MKSTLPTWVYQMPTREHTICAVGWSGPTFYYADCLENAIDNARGHLADSISSTIRTVTIDISDNSRGSFSRDVFVEGSKSAGKAVLRFSQVVERWTDVDGIHNNKGSCYVLVCIDIRKPLESFVEKLEEKKLPPHIIEHTRADAQAAFDALENLENE